jgi:DNA modification methylase
VDLLASVKSEMPEDLYGRLRLDELLDLLPTLPSAKRGRTAQDEVPDPLPEPVTRKGDVWVLGGHRIICADSRDRQALVRLMDGQTAALYCTDPPYGIGFDGTNHPLNARDKAAGKAPGSNSKDWSDVYWDHYSDTDEYKKLLVDVFTVAKEHVDPHAAWYCWHASSMTHANLAAWEAVGVRYHETIIWVKPTFVLGHLVWHYQMEPCLMGWVQGNKPRLNKVEDEQSNVWHIDWEGKARKPADVSHPTVKPVRTFLLPMLKHTRPGDICLETFSGSGSQIIAGETAGRRVFAVERMAEFVDVAVLRWERHVGKEAVLEGDGRTFKQVAAERAPAVVGELAARELEDEGEAAEMQGYDAHSA